MKHASLSLCFAVCNYNVVLLLSVRFSSSGDDFLYDNIIFGFCRRSFDDWMMECDQRSKQPHSIHFETEANFFSRETKETLSKSNSRFCSIRNYCVPKYHYVVIIISFDVRRYFFPRCIFFFLSALRVVAATVIHSSLPFVIYGTLHLICFQ